MRGGPRPRIPTKSWLSDTRERAEQSTAWQGFSQYPRRIGHMAREGSIAEDPWPTKADALAAAGVIADQAAKLYGDELKGVWLYGSRARGDNGPDSDLDVLVVKRSKDFDPRNQLRWELRRALVPEHFDGLVWVQVYIHVAYAEKFEEWDTMFYRNVRADALLVA